MNLIELVDLTKRFGHLVAVDNVSLAIEEGEIRGLIGPNGSGKTTVFNLITGFLKPTGGSIIWRGRRITGQAPHGVTKIGIARTFQVATFPKGLTALQNVDLACHLHTNMGLVEQFFRTYRTRKKERTVEEKARSLLEIMGVADVKHRIVGELPLGHQRAVGIAIALATQPQLLLLDEPMSGMNPAEKKELVDKIKALCNKGLSIILVEHDIQTVMSTCAKIDVLNFGKKIAEGSPNEISQNSGVIEAYLGKGSTDA